MLVPYLFLLPYLILLAGFGILPLLFAIGFSFSDMVDGGFAGLANYATALTDYRFLAAAAHVLTYALIWIPSLVLLAVGLALLLQAVPDRAAGLLRGVFFLPGAVTASALVLLWLFLLDPTISPFGLLWQAFGWHDRFAVLSHLGLAGVFALMALYSGAGGWIVVMHGALSGVPGDVIEAAATDGCGMWQLAWRIKLPMIARSAVFMVVLSIANGLQLFVEPELLRLAGQSMSRPDWSLNQLAYQYAFALGDFGTAAALSLVLLIATMSFSLWIVLRSGFFSVR